MSLSIPLYLIFLNHFVLDVSLGKRYTQILLKEKPNLRFSVFELGNLSVAIYSVYENIWMHSDILVSFPIFMKISFYPFLEWLSFPYCYIFVYWFEGYTYHYSSSGVYAYFLVTYLNKFPFINFSNQLVSLASSLNKTSLKRYLSLFLILLPPLCW